jgi:hypothetical protein
VAGHPDYVTGPLGRRSLADATLFTHVVPDLDAVAAACLAQYLLLTGTLPEHVGVLALRLHPALISGKTKTDVKTFSIRLAGPLRSLFGIEEALLC